MKFVLVYVVFKGLLIVVACHGFEGGNLKTSDGKRITVKDLQALVSADECPCFKGAPKVFLISSCRGSDEIPKYETDGCKTTGLSNMATDFFIAFANVEGKRSYRDITKGIEYIHRTREKFTDS